LHSGKPDRKISNNTRFSDIFFKDNALYCLRSKWSGASDKSNIYAIDKLPLSFYRPGDTMSSSNIITYDIKGRINDFQLKKFSTNIEGLCIFRDTMYVVTDNAMTDIPKCDSYEKQKTLLFEIKDYTLFFSPDSYSYTMDSSTISITVGNGKLYRERPNYSIDLSKFKLKKSDSLFISVDFGLIKDELDQSGKLSLDIEVFGTKFKKTISTEDYFWTFAIPAKNKNKHPWIVFNPKFTKNDKFILRLGTFDIKNYQTH
jgi:hypothetical protein